VELDEVTFAKADGVAELTLNRPASLNAISARPGGMRDQLLHLLADAEADPDVAALLVRGAGRAFCAGGDVTGNAARETAYDELRFLESVDEFHRRVRASPLPSVAAVHGHCLGAGLLLAASCDFVVAAEGALFGLPEGRIGLIGGGQITSVVGRQWAKFLILTGELISARQARDIGLVLAVTADDELASRGRDLAARLARMPREATALNKRSVDAAADAAGDEAARVAARGHDAATLSMADRARTPDGRSFRDILRTEGTRGLKAAQTAQWESSWLRP
jgi:enoyl-CoA hydratase/carnithine racemase